MTDTRPTRVVALVGDQLRHRWLCQRLREDPAIELVGVVHERKRPAPRGASQEDDDVIVDHFAQRDRVERAFFGDAPEWGDLGAPEREAPWNGSAAHAEWIARTGAERLLLFGCGIVADALLGRFPDGVVNFHLGLSPYYRGSGTNFWPLVNGEPECVGITVHLANAKVDAGPILAQARPRVLPDDGPHDIGYRAIRDGAGVLADAVARHARGPLAPRAQRGGGRVYRNADLTAEAIRMMRRRFEDGMIRDYLADKAARDARFPIVE